MSDPSIPSYGAPLYSAAVFNAQIPPEGPKAVPITLNFAVASSFNLNLMLAQSQQVISIIQGAFVDNSTNGQELDINISTLNYTVKVRANKQGYFPLLVPKNATLTVTSAGATVPVQLVLYNIPMAAGTW